jgi:hypothetical protein
MVRGLVDGNNRMVKVVELMVKVVLKDTWQGQGESSYGDLHAFSWYGIDYEEEYGNDDEEKGVGLLDQECIVPNAVLLLDHAYRISCLFWRHSWMGLRRLDRRAMYTWLLLTKRTRKLIS